MGSRVYMGQCLCGAVRYEVRGELYDVHACHCGQCVRQSGHFVVGAGAEREEFHILADETLKWYQSSDFARRGFCSACGSALFWDDGESRMGINAGSLDQPTGLSLAYHIFVDDKPDYYEIADDLPKFAGLDKPFETSSGF